MATMATFAAVVWFMDPFVLFLLGVVPLVWVGIPVVLIAFVNPVFAFRARRFPKADNDRGTGLR